MDHPEQQWKLEPFSSRETPSPEPMIDPALIALSSSSVASSRASAFTSEERSSEGSTQLEEFELACDRGVGWKAGPYLELDAQTESPSYLQKDVDKSSNLGYELQVGEYPDDDAEWIQNTRQQTPMEDVIQLKQDFISQRDQARRAEKEVAKLKATLQRPLWDVHERSQKLVQRNQRREPNQPRLDSKTNRWLYDNTIDQLRECTVHILIRRATGCLHLGDVLASEHYATQALKYAAVLDYEPLSGWCHLHIGKAQYGQQIYDKAIKSFDKAGKAKGVYVMWEEMDDLVSKAAKAQMRQVDGESNSVKSERYDRTLEEELENMGFEDSSYGSRD